LWIPPVFLAVIVAIVITAEEWSRYAAQVRTVL
jgi:hypothetical protein